MERMLRGIAGFFILVSLLLAVKVDIRWLWFTAFVGLNLFQSAFTNWCPMMNILKKFGVTDFSFRMFTLGNFQRKFFLERKK